MNYILCNATQKTFFMKVLSAIKVAEKDTVFIFDAEKLKKIFSEDKSSTGFILIETSLDWDYQELDDFYGFEIAADLRRVYAVRKQIIFFSTFNKKYFEALSISNKKYKLIYGRGCSFITFPSSVEIVKNIMTENKPLSAATLHDVVTMLCDLKGIVIDRLNHELKYQDGIESIKKVIGSITPYLSDYQKQLIQIEDYSQKLQSYFLEKEENLFLSLKQQFLLLCTIHLTDSDDTHPPDTRARHTILIIDDRQDELHKIDVALSKDFIVKTTRKGEEAIQILKADVSNNIIAIISDWRLYEDDSLTYWQPLQGYEILQFAANNGIRSLFALTSQADYVVHHLRNLLGIRFAMFKKDNLRSNDQWKLFKDVLHEACLEAINSRASILDDSAVWNEVWKKREVVPKIAKQANNGKPRKQYKEVLQKTLREQYIELWNSIDRETKLSKINNQVDEIWNYLTREDEPNFVKAQFEHITVSKKVLNLFEVLVLRRIWMALWYNYLPQGKLSESSSSDLANLVYSKIFGKPGDGSVNQKTNNLCLKLSNMSGRMFPEEREWLLKKQLL